VSALYVLSNLSVSNRPLGAAFKRLADEINVLAGALLSPGKVIAEVEQMRKLQLEADRIEAAEPARAAALRQQAAGIGLR
jgi:hypothetical protein